MELNEEKKPKKKLLKFSLSLHNTENKSGQTLFQKFNSIKLKKKEIKLPEVSEPRSITIGNQNITPNLKNNKTFFRAQTSSFNSQDTTLNHSRLNSLNTKNELKKDFKRQITGLVFEMENYHKSQLKGRGFLKLKKENSLDNEKKKDKFNSTQTIIRVDKRRLKTQITKKNLDKLIGFQKDIIKDEVLSQNKKLLQKPTNNVEMNKVLINGFALNQGNTSMSIDYSKKFSDLHEKYYHIMENMKEKKISVRIENFEKLKSSKKTSIKFLSNIKQLSKWEKEYFKNEYNNDKMSNYEFSLYRNNKKKEIEKEIQSKSRDYANIIFAINCDEYEEINKKEDVYESTNGLVSFRNLQRVVKLRNIQKNKEDQEDELNITPSQIRKDRQKDAGKIILTLNNLGPPKYIKSHFRGMTLRKFQSISGNFFGSS